MLIPLSILVFVPVTVLCLIAAIVGGIWSWIELVQPKRRRMDLAPRQATLAGPAAQIIYFRAAKTSLRSAPEKATQTAGLEQPSYAANGG